MTVNELIEQLKMFQKSGQGDAEVVVNREVTGPSSVTCVSGMGGFTELQSSDSRCSSDGMEYVFGEDGDVTLIFIND